MTGVVFDIQEFSVNDGPGMRVTVFLKGCPLRCRWCHNPEGLSFEPQVNRATGLTVGRNWSSDDLVSKLLGFKSAFDLSGGGVTFSGGEPTAQFGFLRECCGKLRAAGVHVNLDTSGYCPNDRFREILRVVDLVYFDVKCVDAELHRKMTGVDNAVILENLRTLAGSDVKYHVRIPKTKGVSDTAANRSLVSSLLEGLPRGPESVDWLDFNELAAAKYGNFGLEYRFDE